jgi:D-alanine-D-alanine ligase
MKVAVVWNNDHSGVVNRFGPPSPERYGRTAVENVVGALREKGHDALLCEGDKTLIATLERFMPPDANGRPTGMVFNMACGIQGECRFTHVPAMLEAAGIPYTGSSPLGHALALDKAVMKRLVHASGLATPQFRLMRHGKESSAGLRFPVVVKPVRGSAGRGPHLVRGREELGAAVRAVVAQHDQEALVEEYVEGRQISVCLIGHDDLRVLPFVEHEVADPETRAITLEDHAEPAKSCPARVDGRLARRLREIAVATFRACHCRDYAGVEMRIDRDGAPSVLGIHSMAGLGVNASYALAAKAAGLSFPGLVERILDVAHRRSFGTGLVREDSGLPRAIAC